MRRAKTPWIFSDYYHIHRTNEIYNQRDYVNEHADELIKAGAQVDLDNNKGGTIVTSALHNSNYELINIIVQTRPSPPNHCQGC